MSESKQIATVAKQTLFELTQEYLMAFNELMEADDLPAEAVRDTLEGLTGELTTKLANVYAFSSHLQAQAEAIDKEIDRMEARKKRLKAKAEWFKENVIKAMEAAQITKVECPWFALSLRKCPPSVEYYDTTIIPTEFVEVKVTEKVKGAEILKELKAGKEVPGAKLAPQKNTLTIR